MWSRISPALPAQTDRLRRCTAIAKHMNVMPWEKTLTEIQHNHFPTCLSVLGERDAALENALPVLPPDAAQRV